jgi:hypothetical protein
MNSPPFSVKSKLISNSRNGPDLWPDKSVFIRPLIENVFHLHKNPHYDALKRAVVVKCGIRFDRGGTQTGVGGSRDGIYILPYADISKETPTRGPIHRAAVAVNIFETGREPCSRSQPWEHQNRNSDRCTITRYSFAMWATYAR